ncbi:MAG: hypothetical protein ACC726_07530, partial [Chloroflexota bacterium]
MPGRVRIIGVITLVIGLLFMGAGVYAYTKVQGGADALESFSHAQDVTLSYNDEGQLVDRGSTEVATEIMALLTDDWNWPVSERDLDPKSPVVDTASEYMYQMATIAYHVLNGSQSVTLAERVEYDGDRDGVVAAEAPVYTTFSLPDRVWDPEVEGYGDATFEAGTYEVPINGRYWTQFNRMHPLDGPARAGAWTGTVFGLFAQLGVG